DGRLISTHASISGLQFSPDSLHLAYMATDGFAGIFASVVEDEKPVLQGSIGSNMPNPSAFFRFSPDSQHLAFVVTNGTSGKSAVFEDGKAVGGFHQAVSDIAFSSTNRLAFLATDPRPFVNGVVQRQVFVDGTALGPTYVDVKQLQFSPDGRHVAFLA